VARQSLVALHVTVERWKGQRWQLLNLTKAPVKLSDCTIHEGNEARLHRCLPALRDLRDLRGFSLGVFPTFVIFVTFVDSA
jgi:hypothetical protein